MTTASSGQLRKPGGTTDRWYLRYLAPTLVVLVVAGFIPVVYTVYLSLTDSPSDSLVARDFVGFGTYAQLLGDSHFWNALTIQVVFVLSAVVVEMVVGFLIASALNREGRFVTLVRTILLAPAVLPTVVVALLFSYLLQSRVGAISFYVEKLGLATDWFDHPQSAMAILVGIDAWQFTPLVAILILAALQGIPAELIEASKLDGAGVIRRTTGVIVPMIFPTLVTVGLLRLIDAVQVFPTIYVLTNGGPGESTNALNFWGFTVFFQYRDTSYGATIAVVLTLGTVIMAFALAAALRKQIRQ
ncbi:MAG: carbohydrate ABC transporter permease [Rhodoglobus sp.]